MKSIMSSSTNSPKQMLLGLLELQEDDEKVSHE